jgi:hypothetical protein
VARPGAGLPGVSPDLCPAVARQWAVAEDSMVILCGPMRPRIKRSRDRLREAGFRSYSPQTARAPTMAAVGEGVATALIRACPASRRSAHAGPEKLASRTFRRRRQSSGSALAIGGKGVVQRALHHRSGADGGAATACARAARARDAGRSVPTPHVATRSGTRRGGLAHVASRTPTGSSSLSDHGQSQIALMDRASRIFRSAPPTCGNYPLLRELGESSVPSS